MSELEIEYLIRALGIGANLPWIPISELWGETMFERRRLPSVREQVIISSDCKKLSYYKQQRGTRYKNRYQSLLGKRKPPSASGNCLASS